MHDLNLGCELDLQIDTPVLTYFADWLVERIIMIRKRILYKRYKQRISNIFQYDLDS
jgi:hypothetical protein